MMNKKNPSMVQRFFQQLKRMVDSLVDYLGTYGRGEVSNMYFKDVKRAQNLLASFIAGHAIKEQPAVGYEVTAHISGAVAKQSLHSPRSECNIANLCARNGNGF